MMFAKQIKTGTKKQKQLVYNHKSAVYRTLNQCYACPSKAKWDAWNECNSFRRDYKGFDMRINSYNTYSFAVSFLFIDPDTGVVMLYTMTRCNHYVCEY